MITKELIKTEIDNMEEQHLEALYKLIKSLQSSTIERQASSTLMTKLKTVTISAPEDFSENIDAYLNREKNV